jgi:uncharacterized protein YhhL (DUF1145 family)
MRHEEFTEQALEAVVRIGVIALLVIWCFEIVHPFIVPIVWGVIIAVAVFLMYRGLRSVGASGAHGRASCSPHFDLDRLCPQCSKTSLKLEKPEHDFPMTLNIFFQFFQEQMI